MKQLKAQPSDPHTKYSEAKLKNQQFKISQSFIPCQLQEKVCCISFQSSSSFFREGLDEWIK